jgi:hypothetical protein
MNREQAEVYFDHVTAHKCPVDTCSTAAGALCDTPGLWVHLERIQLAEQMDQRSATHYAVKPSETPDRMEVLRGYAVSHTQQDSTVLVRLSDEEWPQVWPLFEPPPTLADIARAAFADHLAQKGH